MAEQPIQRRPPAAMVACLLPWTADFKLDEDAFAQHIDDALRLGFDSLYVLGTAGEGYALSEPLYQQVIRVFADRTLSNECRPQVGVIGTSMLQMIDRLALAHDLGFREFQVSLPCWGALEDSELSCFFQTVCSEFPDSGFLHYNLPRARRVLTGADYRRIADCVPNLVATKNNRTPEETRDLITCVPELQHFLLEANYVDGREIGRCSLLCSVGLLFPRLTQRLYAAGSRGDFAEASRISQFLCGFVKELFQQCSRTPIDSAYDKIYVWLRNPEFPLRLLPPYLGFSEEERSYCRRVYEERYQEADQ